MQVGRKCDGASGSVMGGVDARERECVHEDIKGIVSIIRDVVSVIRDY